jgi:hypothetical protein
MPTCGRFLVCWPTWRKIPDDATQANVGGICQRARNRRNLLRFLELAIAVIKKPWLMCVNANEVPNTFEKGNQTMTTKQEQLKHIFKTMNAHDAREIRVAFYKAVEGLEALAEALEMADADQPTTAGPLLDELYVAIEALDAMKKSQLGRIL